MLAQFSHCKLKCIKYLKTIISNLSCPMLVQSQGKLKGQDVGEGPRRGGGGGMQTKNGKKKKRKKLYQVCVRWILPGNVTT